MKGVSRSYRETRTRVSQAGKVGAGDLKQNWSRSNVLCRIAAQQVSDDAGPQRRRSTVVTWTASRLLAAKRLGSRRSRGAESRKAMETVRLIHRRARPMVRSRGAESRKAMETARLGSR